MLAKVYLLRLQKEKKHITIMEHSRANRCLTDLPEEILVFIFQGFDTVTKLNIYNTCKRLRFVMCREDVTKVFQMSLNCIASARTFKLGFFREISQYLQEINMSGVCDLSKNSLVPTLKKLNKLRTLNVSHTLISIADLPDIHFSCPTIKNIKISTDLSMAQELLVREKKILYQTILKHFENVHLVGYCLVYSTLIPCLLSTSNFNVLKFTQYHQYQSPITQCVPEQKSKIQYQFRHLVLYILEGCGNSLNYEQSILPQMESTDTYEFIVITSDFHLVYFVYASPIFQSFFSEHLKLDVRIIIELSYNSVPNYHRNMVIMIWNKKEIEFDSGFFTCLLQQLKEHLPYWVDTSKESTLPANYNWYRLEPMFSFTHELSTQDGLFRIQESRITNKILDYNDLFQQKKEFQLSIVVIVREAQPPVNLPATCTYLKKLTYLHLSGNIFYSEDFFANLLLTCTKLETLVVSIILTLSYTMSSISNSFFSSKTLKNFKLCDKRINYELLFQSLSNCRMLENISIMEDAKHNTLLDPSTIIKNCVNLYSIYFKINVNESGRLKNWLKNAQTKYKRYHLRIGVNDWDSGVYYNHFSHSPFNSVFKLFAIKEL